MWPGVIAQVQEFSAADEARAHRLTLAAETARDAGLVEALRELRKLEVHQIHAGISRQDWYWTEQAANRLRDKIDAALTRA
jgi:hypothetical protein